MKFTGIPSWLIYRNDSFIYLDYFYATFPCHLLEVAYKVKEQRSYRQCKWDVTFHLSMGVIFHSQSGWLVKRRGIDVPTKMEYTLCCDCIIIPSEDPHSNNCAEFFSFNKKYAHWLNCTI